MARLISTACFLGLCALVWPMASIYAMNCAVEDLVAFTAALLFAPIPIGIWQTLIGHNLIAGYIEAGKRYHRLVVVKPEVLLLPAPDAVSMSVVGEERDLVPADGIEPSSDRYERSALPLSYTG